MAHIIKLRRDNAADWTTKNPILYDGEPGVETDTSQMKIGDGVQRWAALPYFIPEGKILELIQNADDLTPEEVEVIVELVREELEIPEISDLVLLWENAKA